VAQVRLARRAQSDLERLFDFLMSREPAAAEESFRGILDALDVLARHPLIGRPVENQLREFVISYGKSGYVALYRFVQRKDLVRVLAIRHQREAGYAG